jgi:6-phosphogluconolactonase
MAHWNVYVGAFTKEFTQEIEQLNKTADIFWRGNHPGLRGTPSQGIERLSFDDDTGVLRHVETTTDDIVSPQYLALHPKLPVVYAAEFARPGRLSAFVIRQDGTLVRGSRTESSGELAVAVTVHPSGNCAYVAHWGDGTLAVLPLDAEGMVTTAEPVAPARSRDGRSARHHEARVTPGGNGLLVTDIGREELVAFGVAPDGALSSSPTARINFPGSSPRHIEFHPSGRFVYIVGERGSMLHVLEAEDGIPRKILHSYSTAPPGYEGKNTPSELDLHPDGQTLYVGNRGSDYVTIFSLDASGTAEPLGYQPSLGRSPRGVRVDPTGRYLLVANRDSGSIVVFEIEQDRRLNPIGAPVDAPAPSSIVFAGTSK